jgi:hypothetical protein
VGGLEIENQLDPKGPKVLRGLKVPKEQQVLKVI